MSIEYWYKGNKRIRIDTADKVAVACFTKKGYGAKKIEAPKPSTPMRGGKKGIK